MRNRAFSQGARLWLLFTAILSGLSLLVSLSVGFAQPSPQADHLKCYTVKDTNPLKKRQVVLQTPQLNQIEDCTVSTRASFMCLDAIKNGGDDPRGVQAGDYLCYKLTECKPPIKQNLFVNDQFTSIGIAPRVVTLEKAQYLCTPTQKEIAPPPCGNDLAPTCSGLCPHPDEACTPVNSDQGCRCL
jgi:hypothetical protein